MIKCTYNANRILSALLSLSIIVSLLFGVPASANAQADVIEKDGIYYKLSEADNYYEVIGYSDNQVIVDVVIPSVINNCKVKAIGKGVFKNCETLESVRLPKGFYSIGDNKTVVDSVEFIQ